MYYSLRKLSKAIYLLLLNLAAKVGDLDFNGVQLFIWDLGDSKRLRLLGALEGQLSQGDIPLAVVLLVFTANIRGNGWCKRSKKTDK